MPLKHPEAGSDAISERRYTCAPSREPRRSREDHRHLISPASHAVAKHTNPGSGRGHAASRPTVPGYGENRRGDVSVRPGAARRAADLKLRGLVFHVKQRHPRRGPREELGLLQKCGEGLETRGPGRVRCRALSALARRDAHDSYGQVIPECYMGSMIDVERVPSDERLARTGVRPSVIERDTEDSEAVAVHGVRRAGSLRHYRMAGCRYSSVFRTATYATTTARRHRASTSRWQASASSPSPHRCAPRSGATG